MLVHPSVTPQQYVAGIHLIYIHWWRERKGSKGPCLRIGNKGLARLEDPVFEVLTVRPHTPPKTLRVIKVCIGQIEASTCPPPPPGHTPGIWHLCRPGEEGIWLSESSRGWGIWSPCFRCGEFELHLRFHVKSLAWRAIMGDAALEDFRGKDCAFVVARKGLKQALCRIWST